MAGGISSLKYVNAAGRMATFSLVSWILSYITKQKKQPSDAGRSKSTYVGPLISQGIIVLGFLQNVALKKSFLH